MTVGITTTVFRRKTLIIPSDKSGWDGLHVESDLVRKSTFGEYSQTRSCRRVRRSWSDLPPRSSISPVSLRVTQPPLQQATANWTCPARCCCIHSWYETDVRSLTGKPRGWSRLCSLFLPTVLPVGIVLRAPEFPLLQHTRDALYTGMYVRVCVYTVERNSNVCWVEMLLSCLQIFLPLLSSTRSLLYDHRRAVNGEWSITGLHTKH